MSYASEELRKLIAEREELLRQPGAVLFSQGRYEIQRALGEGGMGITCLANEISAANLKRPVVLKFVKDSLNPDKLAQFFNEVQLTILFNHPNLVPVYRLESENAMIELERHKSSRRRPHEHTVYYAVMQYIDGWNLRQIVERLSSLRMRLHYDITMYLIARVARGLHYVHAYRDGNGSHLGLVHRDVSPENILIDRFGRVKVADFGIATSAKERRRSPLSNPGKLMYASPEQLSGAPLDARSDVYNVGLLLYFAFTNTDRFRPEARLPRARDRILSKMAKSPLGDLKHVPARIANVCDVCLREDPEARYQSCEDLGTDIDIYFKEAQKVVTNDILEQVLQDLFSADPTFVSRRFISLTGSPRLNQPEYDPGVAPIAEEVPPGPSPTVRLDLDD